MQAYGMSEKWAGLLLTGLTNSQSLFVMKSAVCVTESLLRDDEIWEIYLFEVFIWLIIILVKNSIV